ncbi:MAG TPA: RNA-directed DNA polymerase [Oxalobacteraceae bacterium]|nr:RNA-directed DNA polymerase [Oxalobacteraceae bacterium]
MSDQLFGITYSELQALLYPRQPYKTFIIAKRNGSPRVIHEPRIALKVVQEKLLHFLYENAGMAKPCVQGFTPGRSIVTNAQKHCSPRTLHLLNIDIENFFPSITFYRVRGLFLKKPFEFSHQVATVLAQICTYQGILPQGAPTSPMVANLICRSLDKDLTLLAKRHRAIYTRYCDDITFSLSVRDIAKLPVNICSFDSGVLTLGDELQSIFVKNSFRINPLKSRLGNRRHRLEVTGITINKSPNVKRSFIDSIRGALHAWDKYGYEAATAEWEKRPYKRQRRIGGIPSLKNVLWGKLLYVRMVRGGDDVLYTRLAERYNMLCEKEQAARKSFTYSSLPIEAVVRNAADAENAVFVLEWLGDYKGEPVGGQGTAFAYKDVGLLTCEHVFHTVTENGEPVSFDEVKGATLTLQNPSTGKFWPAKLIHKDPYRDLAVVHFDTRIPPAHRHFSALEAQINRNSKGILIGFPNWSPGKRANQLYVTVLNRFPITGLQRIEINGSVRKGNSGGPFVDELFRVAGVAQQGATQANGNDQCLCVTELDKWLVEIKGLAHGLSLDALPDTPVAD